MNLNITIGEIKELIIKHMAPYKDPNSNPPFNTYTFLSEIQKELNKKIDADMDAGVYFSTTRNGLSFNAGRYFMPVVSMAVKHISPRYGMDTRLVPLAVRIEWRQNDTNMHPPAEFNLTKDTTLAELAALVKQEEQARIDTKTRLLSLLSRTGMTLDDYLFLTSMQRDHWNLHHSMLKDYDGMIALYKFQQEHGFEPDSSGT